MAIRGGFFKNKLFTSFAVLVIAAALIAGVYVVQKETKIFSGAATEKRAELRVWNFDKMDGWQVLGATSSVLQNGILSTTGGYLYIANPGVTLAATNAKYELTFKVKLNYEARAGYTVLAPAPGTMPTPGSTNLPKDSGMPLPTGLTKEPRTTGAPSQRQAYAFTPSLEAVVGGKKVTTSGSFTNNGDFQEYTVSFNFDPGGVPSDKNRTLNSLKLTLAGPKAIMVDLDYIKLVQITTIGDGRSISCTAQVKTLWLYNPKSKECKSVQTGCDQTKADPVPSGWKSGTDKGKVCTDATPAPTPRSRFNFPSFRRSPSR